MPSFTNVELDVKFDPKGMKGLYYGKDIQRPFYETMVEPAMATAAWFSRKMLSDELGSGGWSQVHASGKSSRNLFVARIKGVGAASFDSWAIYEGDVTPANTMMREGTPKQGRPPVSTIKAWIYQKGLSSFGNAIQNIVQRGTSMNRAANPVEELAWAISGSISKKGTSVDHKRLYPGGQKRFDYVAYMVNKRNMLKDVNAEVHMLLGNTYFPLYMAYLRTGNRGKGSVVSVRSRYK